MRLSSVENERLTYKVITQTVVLPQHKRQVMFQ